MGIWEDNDTNRTTAKDFVSFEYFVFLSDDSILLV